MKTTNVPKSTCPNCTQLLDRASSDKDHTPQPGDLSICSNCAALLVFDQDMQLRMAKPKDLEGLSRAAHEHLLQTKLEVITMIAIRRITRHRDN